MFREFSAKKFAFHKSTLALMFDWCFIILFKVKEFAPYVHFTSLKGEKKTFIGICVAFPKMRENQTLNHPAYLRMCVMQKMLSTAWTGNGCVAGRLKSSLPRVTGRVSVELQFIYLFIITNKLFCLSASVFAVDWNSIIIVTGLIPW